MERTGGVAPAEALALPPPAKARDPTTTAGEVCATPSKERGGWTARLGQLLGDLGLAVRTWTERVAVIRPRRC
jgi:hypothetical protein